MAKLVEFEGVNFDENSIDVERLLSGSFLYEQLLVKYIKDGKSYIANSRDELNDNPDCPIKIEGLERLNFNFWSEVCALSEWHEHTGTVTAHLFISPKDSLSFPLHSDPADVLIWMLVGEKEFHTEEQTFTLKAGNRLLIDCNELHYAVNTEFSVMLSFGFERFIEDNL